MGVVVLIRLRVDGVVGTQLGTHNTLCAAVVLDAMCGVAALADSVLAARADLLGG